MQKSDDYLINYQVSYVKIEKLELYAPNMLLSES